MKVVAFIRDDAFRVLGGPTVQLRRYVEYLRACDIDVSVETTGRHLTGRFDIAHLFNLDWPLETACQYKAARRCADKVVISTIHHRNTWMEELHRRARGGVAATLARLLPLTRYEATRGAWLARGRPSQWGEAAVQMVRGPRVRQLAVLESVDRWLTLAEGERESLEQDFGITRPSSHVPNGALAAEGAPLPPGLPEDFLLCVGRVEARKNQLMLLDAAERLDLPVVLAGAPNANHRAICGEVERRASRSSRVVWLREVDYQTVATLHRLAACHVLPSWCEVLPLVDLEAAIAGNRVVTTLRGYTREYLGDYGQYWDPASGAGGLAHAITRALERDRPEPIPLEQLSWDRAGEALVAAYRDTLEHDGTASA